MKNTFKPGEQPRPPVFSMAMLIGGTAIGAGILSIPVYIGLAGVFPALLGIVVMWGIMLASAFMITKSLLAIRDPRIDLFSLYSRTLGNPGKVVTIVGYLIMLYGVMVAYLCGGTTILAYLLHLPHSGGWLLSGLFLLLTGFTLFGVDIVRRGNAVLMLMLIGTFLLLNFFIAEDIDPRRYRYTDWGFLPSALPIVLCSFAFHIILPTVCRRLDYRPREVRRALIGGTLLPLILTFLWILAATGALPLTGAGTGNLLAAFQKALPVTIPLSVATGSSGIFIAGAIFAFIAIITSYFGVGLSMMSFFRDLTSGFIPGRGTVLIPTITFLPPFLIAHFYPGLFLYALDIVGGLGVVTVLGLLPCLIVIRARRGRKTIWPYILFLVFLVLLVLEICQKSGLLRIRPGVECSTFQVQERSGDSGGHNSS